MTCLQESYRFNYCCVPWHTRKFMDLILVYCSNLRRIMPLIPVVFLSIFPAGCSSCCHWLSDMWSTVGRYSWLCLQGLPNACTSSSWHSKPGDTPESSVGWDVPSTSSAPSIPWGNAHLPPLQWGLPGTSKPDRESGGIIRSQQPWWFLSQSYITRWQKPKE